MAPVSAKLKDPIVLEIKFNSEYKELEHVTTLSAHHDPGA